MSTEKKVIVVFKEEISRDIIRNSKGKIRKELKNLKAVAIDIPLSQISKLKNNPNVSIVESDILIKTSGQTLDWGIKTVKPTPELSSYLTGKGIKIAVIDTGIAPHPDLNIINGISTVAYTSSYIDDNGHGTNVSGIICAKDDNEHVVGVAPQAELLAVKSFDQSGNGYLSDVIEGINWSVMQKVDIINLSFVTSQHSELLESVVNKAYNDGILVVGAAGNNNSVQYPAKYSSVIAVSAIDWIYVNTLDKNLGFLLISATIDNPNINAQGFLPEGEELKAS